MTRDDSVLRGAFLLSVAGIICKFLGAAYRIPLVRLLGDEGIGLYQTAYPVYLVIMALATAGVPLAISKLVAERAALGDYGGVRRVFRIALIALGSLGTIGGAAMALGARAFARSIVADPRAGPVILSLAPAVPLMAFMAALRGFFQGSRDMLPSALSQLVEQVVRVATLLILALLLLPFGIDRAAAGAAFGASAGGAAGLALLVWWYFTHPWPPPARGKAAPYRFLAHRLCTLALPIAMGALLFPLMQAVDSVLVPARLQKAGYSVGEATAALGQLGNAWAVIHFPTTIAAALAVSLVPAVSAARARREHGAVLAGIAQSLRMSAVIGLPAAAGLCALSREICLVLFGSSSAALALRILAPAAFLLGLQGICAGALQGLGRPFIPVRNFACGFAFKLALTAMLCANPSLGSRGAGIGTVAGAALAAGMNLWELAVAVRLPLSFLLSIARAGAASAFMAWALLRLGSYAPQAGPFTRLAALFCIGLLLFALALWILGGVERQDVEVLRRLWSGRPVVSGFRPARRF